MPTYEAVLTYRTREYAPNKQDARTQALDALAAELQGVPRRIRVAVRRISDREI